MFCQYCGANILVGQQCCTVKKELSFSEYRELTTQKRSNIALPSLFKKKKKGDKRFADKALITIKEMLTKNGNLNPRSGFSIPLECNTNDNAFTIKKNGHEKMKRYSPNFDCEIEGCKLVYKSGDYIQFIPGTKEPFSLRRYKEDSGLAYSRITLYLQKYDDDEDDFDFPSAFER